MSHVTTGIEPLTPSKSVRRRSPRLKFLLWTVGIVVVGFMLISVLLPSLCGSRETTNRIKCASNLRQIGQAIALYAQANGGQYPPSLAMLLTQKEISSAVMICPSSNDESSSANGTAGAVAELQAAEINAPGHKHCLSYVYAGRGLSAKTVSETTVVVYEPLENHGDKGVDVLFGDGHVEFIGKPGWLTMAAGIATATHQSPATSP